MWDDFVLNTRKRFCVDVLFQSQQKELRFLYKTVLSISKIVLRLTDRHIFIWLSLKILSVFNTLTLKQFFGKTETTFKKLENCFSVKSSAIENATFPCKTALSKANVEKNKMWLTKRTYHKERSLTLTTLYFRKLNLTIPTSYK